MQREEGRDGEREEEVVGGRERERKKERGGEAVSLVTHLCTISEYLSSV